MIRNFILGIALVAAGWGCGTGAPGGHELYDKDKDQPTLLVSEIKMVTRLSRNPNAKPEVRTLLCRDGRVTATVQTERGEGQAEISLVEYGRLWRFLLANGCFDLKVENPDPKGGYYHLVTCTLGNRVGRFSAQVRTNFLGFGTRNIQKRIELSNAIARLTGRTVKLSPKKTPGKNGDGK